MKEHTTPTLAERLARLHKKLGQKNNHSDTIAVLWKVVDDTGIGINPRGIVSPGKILEKNSYTFGALKHVLYEKLDRELIKYLETTYKEDKDFVLPLIDDLNSLTGALRSRLRMWHNR